MPRWTAWLVTWMLAVSPRVSAQPTSGPGDAVPEADPSRPPLPVPLIPAPSDRDEAATADEPGDAAGDEVPGEDPAAAAPDPPREAEADSGPEQPEALPDNVPVDDEGAFLGKDHTGTPPKPPLESQPPPADERWTANYDGRPEGGVPSEEVLVWIPRGLLLPVHLALDYVVRRPLVALLTEAEEHHVFEKLVGLFTFADGDAAIFPSAFVETGRGAWIAANFFYDNAWVEGHRIDAFAGYGTSGWYDLSVGDSWKVFDNDSGELSFDATLVHDPTWAFTGLGPDTSLDDQVFFAEDKLQLIAELRVAFEGLNRLGISLGGRQVRLGGGRSPSIDAPGSPFDPGDEPGFAEPYHLVLSGLSFELDSRSPEREFTPGSGVRLEGGGTFNFGFDEEQPRFFRYSLRPVAFWDISGANHVLSVSLYAEALSRAGGGRLPLNELVTLGGEDYLRGFIQGRLRDDCALVHSIAYTWPVLFFLDGLLFAELGGVFSGFYRDLDYGKMLADWGFGFRSGFSREFGIDLLFAFGTNQVEQWDDGLVVDNFRVVLGATSVY